MLSAKCWKLLLLLILVVIMLAVLVVVLVVLCFHESEQQQCTVNIPDYEKRDCYPWVGASQTLCEARGCAWCDNVPDGVPHCYHNDKVCPSQIPESSRSECLPEGGGRLDCLRKNCIWCESSTAGIPWCFTDSSVSLGGELCRADIPTTARIDCHPDPGASKDECVRRGCFWCEQSPLDGTPWCFQPPEQGYRVSGSIVETAKGYTATLQRINTPSWFGADITNVRLDVEFQTNDRLRIKFSDASKSRFEVPLTITSPPTKPATTQYDVTFTTSPVFSIQVRRKDTNAIVFDTSIGGLIISDQFLQIATKLNTGVVYGFGEHEHPSLKHNMNWKTWAMYARDQAVSQNNLYGTQPFYINIEQSGRAHGVLFLNSNAQDVRLMPAPGLTYRTVGGVLDIYMFFGPSPDNVVEQFTEATGRPVMVPYWSLGFQLCRYGYRNTQHMREAVGRMRQYNIPHDVQYADIDYMQNWRDFTIDATNFGDLPEYVQQLKQEGTRFIIILDPAIYRLQPPGAYPAFDRGNQYDVWVKTNTGVNAPGTVWPGAVYFPDYSNPNTQTWWTQECVLFHDRLKFDGLWIDMNEPANFDNGYSGVGCENSPINNPPFVPPTLSDGSLWYKTVCPDAKSVFGIHYNTHNLYGWSMAKQSLPAARAATGTRSVVFSRSTFPGGGAYAQHWLGDNWSNWNNLRYSVIGVMEFNMFGYPYVGPDICGFIGETNEELCLRWQQIGAFYTFSRNHNAIDNPDQDPGIWPSVGNAARETLLIRYTLLPYLYTLFHKTHTEGTPVLRPLVFEFPTDSGTYDRGAQMMWGNAILFSPVLDPGRVSVNAYFPNARWFSYYDGAEVPVRGGETTLSAPLDFIPIHIHGGHIIPTQKPANSTMFSRSLPMGLIVALDDDQAASGSLFWDDGESLDTYENNQYYLAQYTATAGSLESQILYNGYSGVNSLILDTIKVMGLSRNISTVTINGSPVSSWSQNTNTRLLTIINLSLPVSSAFAATWS